MGATTKPDHYYPFSMGVRGCPGQAVAFMISKLVASRLITALRLTPGMLLPSLSPPRFLFLSLPWSLAALRLTSGTLRPPSRRKGIWVSGIDGVFLSSPLPFSLPPFLSLFFSRALRPSAPASCAYSTSTMLPPLDPSLPLYAATDGEPPFKPNLMLPNTPHGMLMRVERIQGGGGGGGGCCR